VGGRVVKTIAAIVVVLWAGSSGTLIAGMQSGSRLSGLLNPRIGAAVPQRYQAVLDAKHWANPYLVIRPVGVLVIAKGPSTGEQTVAVADLERTLIELPVAAWPYGRVVAVQVGGLRGGERDDKLIADNAGATVAILKRLEVTVEYWPN